MNKIKIHRCTLCNVLMNRRYPRKTGRKTDIRCPECEARLSGGVKLQVLVEFVNDVEKWKLK